MAQRVAVDIGGTFTDFCLFDDGTRALTSHKVLSTPDRPGSEIGTGLAQLASAGAARPAEITWFSHGTTVGVNTVIQRRGAVLALFVTEGFEDVLELARLKVPDPYNIFSRRPDPLVARERVWGIPERILKDGSVETPVDVGAVHAATQAALAAGAETIIVATLHSYANPAHERAIRAAILAEMPDMTITLSSDVWPVIREYERTVTATVAGYVQRRVAEYLSAFQAAVSAAGVPATPMIGKSNGGVMSAELGKSQPISVLLSGTAAGVIGAADVAARAGTPNVLSFDVGGTSADVAVIRDGAPAFGSGELVGEFPIHVPTVSVTSIGEGGGSIASVDGFGVLKVGPESAGSSPGPACFGRGGTQPTITDAFAVLGLLGAGDLGYGAVTLDRAAAEAAMAPLAAALGIDLRATAESILRVAVSGMYLETSKLLSRHGADPRDFALLAFGGAGPMTACLLARELGVAQVIVPPTPGVLSAYGGLIADIRNDFIRTVFADLTPDQTRALSPIAQALETEARHWLHVDQGFAGTAHLIWTADMRYRGQSYEIETPIDVAALTSGNIAPIAAAFHAAHHRAYDHSDPEAEAQIVNLRLVVAGVPAKPDLRPVPEAEASAQPKGRVAVFFDGAAQEAALFDRDRLAPGHRFAGPAIVTQSDCTTIIPPGFAARIDGWSNLVIMPEG
ncbi:MAG: hydantoinase/oxoprolinase family protein [Pseudomonadota bacterium]